MSIATKCVIFFTQIFFSALFLRTLFLCDVLFLQIHLKDKDKILVKSFTEELIQVRGMFLENQKKPPNHKNMPPIVSKLLWMHGLKRRIEVNRLFYLFNHTLIIYVLSFDRINDKV